MDWIPAYLDLWVDDKADLSHSTRSIFLRLCHAARRACRDGLVVLPPSSPTDEAGVHSIVLGKMAEVKIAISEMVRHSMASFETHDGLRCLRILSWTPAWVLGTMPDDQAYIPGAQPRSRGGRPRKWASEADRSRARRDNRSTGNQAERPETRPETKPVTDNRSTGNETGYSEGGKGGEEIKSEEKRVENNHCGAGARDESKAELPPVGTRKARRRSARAATIPLPVGSAEPREHPLPVDWQPNEAHRELGTREGVDVDREAMKMRLWADSKTGINWNSRFSRWLMKTGEDRRAKGEPPFVPPEPPAARREPPPPKPIPDFDRIKEMQQRRLEEAYRRELEMPPDGDR